jgi:hypothetical protein
MIHYYLKKMAAIGFLAFLVLWVLGTLRDMDLPHPQPLPISIAFERDYSPSLSNFANNLKQIGLVETPLPLMLDNPEVGKIRIHEKRAVLTTATTAFNEDEAKVRAAIKAEQAEIFTEKNSGINPNRKLILEIGVHPDRFEGLVDSLRKIGHLSTIHVEQKDRTGEFRKLHAQRQSLQKYLEAIIKLREGKNPSLDDALKLEQKIQDLEKELQTLSLQMGDLLGKESYYHVHLSLGEYQPGDRRDHTFTTPQRLFHGFLWALAWWFAVVFALALAMGAVVSVWTLRRL